MAEPTPPQSATVRRQPSRSPMIPNRRFQMMLLRKIRPSRRSHWGRENPIVSVN
jgi:hypothetical protein